MEIASNFTLERISFYKSALHIEGTFRSEIPKDLNQRANKILARYLNLMKSSLRILGGHPNAPFMRAAAYEKIKETTGVRRNYYFIQRSEQVVDYYFLTSAERNPKLIEIVKNNKVDADSLSIIAACIASSGRPEWVYVRKRIQQLLKPLLLTSLLEGTLADPISKGSANDQNLVLQSPG